MQIVDQSLLLRETEETRRSTGQRETNIIENPSLMDANTTDCLHSILKIGVACSVESPKDRMVMGEVIKELHLVKKALLSNENHGARPRR